MSRFEFFKEISVGGLTKENLFKRLTDCKVQFNPYAQTLFEHPSFLPDRKTAIVRTLKVHLSDLNLRSPCSYKNIMDRASEFGLAPAPLCLGAFLRLEYLQQPEGPYLTIASAQLETDESAPTGFYLRNFENSLWLRGYRVTGEPEWPARNEFVFLDASFEA